MPVPLNQTEERPLRCCLVVLGDIGRSPRMCGHAASFLHHGYAVDFVGYGGSTLPFDLETSEKLEVHKLSPSPNFFGSGSIGLMGKFIWQFLTLLWTLLFNVGGKTAIIMVQNPPGLPTLAVVWFVARLRGISWAVDWHNYTDSILALKIPETHVLVRLAGWFENFFGRRADVNFCVSKAMREDLEIRRNVTPVPFVFYDRPNLELFRASRQTDGEKHALLMRLGKEYPSFVSHSPLPEHVADSMLYSAGDTSGPLLKHDRPAVLVSSTSWTADEDFGILLDALIAYNIIAVGRHSSRDELPKVVAVITGKGPQKEEYLEKIKKLNLDFVTFVTPWLEPEDYPKFLALATLGVCLHTSSSGLDLPMKVVDMLGAGVPVVAKRYETIHELVKDGENGLLFDTPDELATSLIRLLTGFPACVQDEGQLLGQLRGFRQLACWNETWDNVVWPVVGV